MLEFENVSKSYWTGTQSKVILDRASFRVDLGSSLGVEPVAPDEATYPRALENTILAFLVFAGIYLMISLTASILREQVTT
ncbi:MAG: hypothetical protein P8H36_06170 [Yoonia sp.]|nr:hypothetical protein [Yoonia sp.]MDG1768977.1 hypothetical protein [Yoonia sp.]MDG1868064.1 hypothetical protein [Yoonia sp.]